MCCPAVQCSLAAAVGHHEQAALLCWCCHHGSPAVVVAAAVMLLLLMVLLLLVLLPFSPAADAPRLSGGCHFGRAPAAAARRLGGCCCWSVRQTAQQGRCAHAQAYYKVMGRGEGTVGEKEGAAASGRVCAQLRLKVGVQFFYWILIS